MTFLLIAVLLIVMVPLFIWLLAKKLFSRKKRSASRRDYRGGVTEFLSELGNFADDFAD